MSVTVENIAAALAAVEGPKPTIVVTATTVGLKQSSLDSLGLTLKCSNNCPETEFSFAGAEVPAKVVAAPTPEPAPAPKAEVKAEASEPVKKSTKKTRRYFGARQGDDEG